MRLDDESSDSLYCFASKGQTAPRIRVSFANDLLERDALEFCSHVKLSVGLEDVNRALKQLLVN